MNFVVLMGNISRDLDWVQDSRCRFNIAVQRNYSKDGVRETDFINCVAFKKTGDFIGKYFKKGSKILINGEIRVSSYTNKDGEKVYSTEVVVNNAEFCEKAESKPQIPEKNDGFFVPVEDEGLPFE